MDTRTQDFERLRPRLQSIAYRMLGSTGEAEEVVQDAWLRWHEAEPGLIDNDEAWLVATTTRLAIDRLRHLKVQREHYAGLWLPEPQVGDAAATPEALVERWDDVSVAFLAVLERLAPEARAAFLLRQVFDADYAEIGRIVGKSEPAVRQLVHRARSQVAEGRPRYAVPAATHRRLLEDFASAMTSGDFGSLRSLLAEEAELVGDGGGKVPSFGKPLAGGQRIAQLYFAAHLKSGSAIRVRIVPVNGEWGLLRFFGDTLESVQTCETDGERILRIRVQRNPDKLARIARSIAPAR